MFFSHNNSCHCRCDIDLSLIIIIMTNCTLHNYIHTMYNDVHDCILLIKSNAIISPANPVAWAFQEWLLQATKVGWNDNATCHCVGSSKPWSEQLDVEKSLKTMSCRMVSCSKISRCTFARTTFFCIIFSLLLRQLWEGYWNCIESMSICRHVSCRRVLSPCQIAW